MFGLPFELLVEGSVALLLLLTLGYCVVLNERLKRLHQDKGALRQMVTDLVQATELAHQAIQSLKETAQEADVTMGVRVEEAERFAIQLANHVNAGQNVLERISMITDAAKTSKTLMPPSPANRANAALEKLRAHQRGKDHAA